MAVFAETVIASQSRDKAPTCGMWCAAAPARGVRAQGCKGRYAGGPVHGGWSPGNAGRCHQHLCTCQACHKRPSLVQGWLVDGTEFRSGETLQFQLGEGEVIEGWERGLAGMW